MSINSAGVPHPSDINVNLTSFSAGIISYTEYLFLLSILTSKRASARKSFLLYSQLFFAEPKSGFEIAFNMFDTDGNQRVDKDEFLVVSIIRNWKMDDISLGNSTSMM